MANNKGMTEHFDTIARRYRGLRTTDEEPVHYVREALAGQAAVKAADIGCGAGRYGLLLFRHLPRLHLTCVDSSGRMLAELSRHLSRNGITRYETIDSRIETLDLGKTRFDCVLTFNAVHHFHFPTFLSKAASHVRDGGRVFVYTRTRSQNARSVWGRYFPGFCERERRLPEIDEMKRAIRRNARLRLIDVKPYRYRRVATLDRLVAQARAKHYSTFSLYAPVDLDRAVGAFKHGVRRDFKNRDAVRWHDENVMLQLGHR
jgi:SAM-dependent methyltransferase